MNDLSVISRVRSLTLTDFRSFKARRPGATGHVLNTDADLVLISGANGHGKTSVLEALTLLLTGWSAAKPIDLIARDRGERSGSKNPGPQPPPEGKVRDRFVLSATVQGLDSGGKQSDGELSLSFPEGDASLAMPKGLPASPLYEKERDDRELSARLCAFFQDRLDRLFDQAASGRTLRDVFEPIPDAVKDVQEVVDALLEALDAEENNPVYQDEWKGAPVEALDQAVEDAWGAVFPVLQQFSDARKELEKAELPAIPQVIRDEAGMDAFADALVKALGGRQYGKSRASLRSAFRNILVETLAADLGEARRQAAGRTEETARLERERDEAQSQLDTYQDRYPTLEADLAHFSVPEEDASPEDPLPDALQVFKALAKSAEKWSRPVKGEEGRLARVVEEFGKVVIKDSINCYDILYEWLDERKDAWNNVCNLKIKIENLNIKIRQSYRSNLVVIFEEIDRKLRRALSDLVEYWGFRHEFSDHRESTVARKRAREALGSFIQDVTRIQADLKQLTDADEELMESLRQRAEDVLWRFSLVEGVLPLGLVAKDIDSRKDGGKGADGAKATPSRRIYTIRTADGRELEHLSTGQRAQVGVSLLAAQNIAATRLLNHRVILLDDVTTAYDLSNLTREAILWRQFAYGAGSADDKEAGDGKAKTDRNTSALKRQIFISSHHEDMTNHMLDLLVPPPGRTMRLIRFTGWSNENGPEYESFDVESSQDVGSDKTQLTGLKEALRKL